MSYLNTNISVTVPSRKIPHAFLVSTDAPARCRDGGYSPSLLGRQPLEPFALQKLGVGLYDVVIKPLVQEGLYKCMECNSIGQIHVP